MVISVDNMLDGTLKNNYIQQLDRQLNENHLLKHPFYQAWSAGKLTLDDLRVYACQYYFHVEAFPRYVSATHSNCSSQHARQILLENLNDEEGMNGLDSHSTLWIEFAKGLGLSEETLTKTIPFPETKQFIEDFLLFSRTSYAEGLGALYAYERQIPQTATSKLIGLRQFYNIENQNTLKFFLVHLETDVEHAEATKLLIQDLPPEQKTQAGIAAKKISKSIWNMLSGIQSRTMNSPHPPIV